MATTPKKSTPSGTTEMTRNKSQGRTSLADTATQLLRDQIIDLTLVPGERIDERVLLNKYSISRTPVREALNRLSTEGLVEVRSNLGAYAAPMSLKHTMELLTAYVLSERTVASVCNIDDASLANDLEAIQKKYERAADKQDMLLITELNSRFHGRIAISTNNQFITNYAADLHNLVRRVSFFVYQREKEQLGDFDTQLPIIIGHHHAIIDAVRRGDQTALIEISTKHAGVFRKRLATIFGTEIDCDLDLRLWAQ